MYLLASKLLSVKQYKYFNVVCENGNTNKDYTKV